MSEVNKVPWKWWVGLVTQTTLLAPLKIILTLLGLIIVPIGLLFKKKGPIFSINYELKGEVVTEYHHEIHLPEIFWLWDNQEEGLTSRFPRWWTKTKGKASSYWPMVYWGCLRNPVNNLRFTKWYQADMKYLDHKVYQSKYWFLVRSTHRETGKVYYTYRYRKYRDDGTSALYHFGYKCFPYIIHKMLNNPEMMKQSHHRYRGWAIQILPNKGA